MAAVPRLLPGQSWPGRINVGGNATAIGACANGMVPGIAERDGQRISFWRFTRSG